MVVDKQRSHTQTHRHTCNIQIISGPPEPEVLSDEEVIKLVLKPAWRPANSLLQLVVQLCEYCVQCGLVVQLCEYCVQCSLVVQQC